MLVSKGRAAPPRSLQRYLFEHMTPLNPHMAKLRTPSLQDPDWLMLGSSYEMNFLQMLISTLGAKKTLDIGVFSGYSALMAAQVLPADGKVVACDVTDKWVEKYGRAVWKEAGVEDKIDLRIAPAVDTLEALIADGQAGTFDYAFIDADKSSYIRYYEACLKLVRVGGIVAVDNALWSGHVLEEEAKMDEETRTIHQLNELAVADPRVHASLLNIADGLLLCRRVQ